MHIHPGGTPKTGDAARVFLQDVNSNVAFFLHFLLILQCVDDIIRIEHDINCTCLEEGDCPFLMNLQDKCDDYAGGSRI